MAQRPVNTVDDLLDLRSRITTEDEETRSNSDFFNGIGAIQSNEAGTGNTYNWPKLASERAGSSDRLLCWLAFGGQSKVAEGPPSSVRGREGGFFARRMVLEADETIGVLPSVEQGSNMSECIRKSLASEGILAEA